MKPTPDAHSLMTKPVASGDKARAAVAAFRQLQPTLTSYARNLTRRQDVSVEMSVADNGSTDGKRIFYRPPMALGEAAVHARSTCSKRDKVTGVQLCQACATREEVLVTIYHEIAHIAFESFISLDKEDAAEVAAKAAEDAGGHFSQAIADRIRRDKGSYTKSYIGVCNLVSPFMPFLYNCLEDARVNAEMFKVRPGTKVMFDSSTKLIFDNGVEQVDPRTGEVIVKMWHEYPQNMQVMIGLFCKASGYTVKDEWFIDPVREALADEEINKLIGQLTTVRSTAGIYSLGFPMLKRLRELGFCLSGEDPDEPDKENDDKSDDEPGGESGSDPEVDSERADGGTPPPGDRPGERQSGGSEASEGKGGEDPSSQGSSSGSSGGDSEEEGESEADDPEGEPREGEESEGSEDNADSDGDPGDDSRGKNGSPLAEAEADSDDEADASDSDDDPSGGEELEGSEVDEEDAGSGSDHEDSGDAVHSGSDAEQGEGNLGGSQPAGEDDRLIDTGADDGTGGTWLEELDEPAPPMGTPEEVKVGLEVFGKHEDKPKTAKEVRQEASDDKALEVAIIQGMYFETPSRNIRGVREHKWGVPNLTPGGYDTSRAWDAGGLYSVTYGRKRAGIGEEIDVAESILGPALLRMRVAFAENQRGAHKQHLKSGRVNGRVLGKRAHAGDPRLFRKKVMPGKRDYFVILGMDISGSTVGLNLVLEKQAVMAQAQLCARMGIPFAIYAHTGTSWRPDDYGDYGLALDVYLIKEPDEPWDNKTQDRLKAIGPDAANLDGHFLEYLRKVADKRNESDIVICYFSDGKMPAENHDEELEILQREIKVCAKKNYTLLGVGIRTDSPARHGLPTVQVDGPEDTVKVVRHIERRLLEK